MFVNLQLLNIILHKSHFIRKSFKRQITSTEQPYGAEDIIRSSSLLVKSSIASFYDSPSSKTAISAL